MPLGGMVLCAGLGTRLQPLTDVVPKPACPVLNRPLVAYNLALLKQIGVASAVINTHHLADRLAEVAGREADALGLGLHVSHEPTLLGPGGGVKAAEHWLSGGTFVLLNGDFIFDLDLDRVLEAHRRSGAAATLVVVPMPEGANYRPLHGLADGTLACLPGQPPPTGALPWHFTGVHVLEAAIFEGLERGPSGIFETGYRSLLARGERVLLQPERGRWRDIGAPEHYLDANLDGVAGALPLHRFPALGHLAAIDPRADVQGEVTGSVVGPGATVPKGAQVRRSVVLPDTRLREGEVLDRCIAVGDLRIQVPAPG